MKQEKPFLLNATQFDERVTLCCHEYDKSYCISKILSPESGFTIKGIQQSAIRINYKPNKKKGRQIF